MSATAKDLDETRRLIYGCLVASRTKRWEVVGTVANALLHHGPGVELKSGPLLDLLVEVVEDGDEGGSQWLLDRVVEINARLQADGPAVSVVSDDPVADQV